MFQDMIRFWVFRRRRPAHKGCPLSFSPTPCHGRLFYPFTTALCGIAFVRQTTLHHENCPLGHVRKPHMDIEKYSLQHEMLGIVAIFEINPHAPISTLKFK